MRDAEDRPDITVKCRLCGNSYPKTAEFFKTYSYRTTAGVQRSLRKVCRICHDSQVDKWQQENQEAMRENVRRYQTRRPEIRGIYSRNRRARKLQAVSDHYTEELVIETYGAVCRLCQNPIDLTAPRQPGVDGWEMGLHLDHLIPLSKGGDDTLENIRPTHGICNLRRPKNG